MKNIKNEDENKLNLSKSDIDHLIEKVRKVNSNTEAYDHFLNTIADDIEKEFDNDKFDIKEKIVVDKIVNFVKNWKA